MRVAVLGAGYAGLTLARTLESSLPAATELVVVDESPDHVLQHELHRVIRDPEMAGEISLPLEAVLDCEIRQGRVTAVDPDSGRATFADGETLAYDVGAVCLGSAPAEYGIPGLTEHATPLTSLADAHAIREGFDGVQAANGTVVVGGAGLTGVQVAGELAAIAAETDTAPDIRLLEAADTVAPTFEAPFQSALRQALTDRGVTVQTGTAIEAVEAKQLTLADDTSRRYDQLVWTGGIRGPDALDGERPQVQSDLRLGGPTFAVGDAAAVVDKIGTPAPASAQTAIRQARVAAENMTRLVAHKRDGDGSFRPSLERYTFESPGWVVSVGDGAVAAVGGQVLTGAAATALKRSVGAGYLGNIGSLSQALSFVRAEGGLGTACETGDGPDD
jgi:NADH dehydrogenase